MNKSVGDTRVTLNPELTRWAEGKDFNQRETWKTYLDRIDRVNARIRDVLYNYLIGQYTIKEFEDMLLQASAEIDVSLYAIKQKKRLK